MKTFFLILTILIFNILGYSQKPVVAKNGVKFGTTIVDATEGATLDGNTVNIHDRFADTPTLSGATEAGTLYYTKSQTMAIPIQDGVQHSHTGNTNATVVFSDTLPANSITAYGKFKVESLWTSNNSVGTKTCTVYMRNVGGSDTSISSATLSSTTIVGHAVNVIRMRNSLTSQISYSTGIAAGYGTTTAATKAYTIDFAQPVIFTFSITLGTGTDNAALEGCSVEIYNGRYQ